jgi:hydrogenase-4 component F
MAYALLHAGLKASLTFDQLLQNANMLSKPWLYAGFVLLLVGYGTKMGLAPMHTWKPDAYGEAPGVVGALMAGAVTSCAFLAIARVYYICVAAGESQYAGKLLIFIGLLSMAMAGALMLGQRDFKRSLAYSSVEHMGILVIGLGLGGSAIYAAWLHMINNALAKGVMFLSAGNIHRAYESKRIDNVTGAIRRLPLSGTLFLIGFIAIAGSPPFGPFVSIFSMLNTAFVTGKIWTGVLFLLFLLLVFIGMGATVLSVTLGKSDSDEATSGYQENIATSNSKYGSHIFVAGL